MVEGLLSSFQRYEESGSEVQQNASRRNVLCIGTTLALVELTLN